MHCVYMQIEEWLKSNEVLKVLKIKSCELMHLRIDKKLDFIRRGNAYLYSKSSVLIRKNNAK